MPAIYQFRPFTAAGGLMSYGSNEAEYYRLVGIYAGEFSRATSPPISRSSGPPSRTVINLKTAKALGITVPLPLSGRADEVIE